jgi:cytoskeletal protein CcmA (bactofilin family)
MDYNDILIGQNATLTGDLKTEVRVHLSGQVIGSIYSDKDILINESGVAKGSVECIDYQLSGTHEGEVTAKKIHLTKSAKLMGDITSNTLIIEEGAVFIGTSKKQREKLDSRIDKYDPIYEI